MKHKLALGLTLVIISGFPFTVMADTAPKIVISEVNWAGSTTSDADEWLELQNLEEKTIDVTGWSIDGAGSKGGPLTLPAGATIPAHGIYLISNYDAAHSSLNVAPDFVTTAISLSNSSLRLVLRDGSGTEIDSAGTGGLPPAGLSGSGGLGGPASMIRSGDGWITATTSQNFDPGVTQFGTPGIADVPIPTPTPVPVVVPDPTPVPEPEVVVTEPIAEADPTPVIETPVETTPAPVAIDDPIDPPAVDPVATDTTASDPTPAIEPSVPDPVAVDAVTPGPVVAESAPVIIPTVTTPTVKAPLAYTPGTLVINEILSRPSSGEEWVEITEPYGNVIPLDGWTIVEGGGKAAPLTGLLGWDQFAVGTFSGKLNNAGDDVKLLDGLGDIIDEVRFGNWDGSTLPAPGIDQSLARKEDGSWAITTTPTENGENVITAPVVAVKSTVATVSSTVATATTDTTTSTVTQTTTPTITAPSPTTLELTALLPNPDGSDDAEYIELMNTGTVEVSLAGWTLTDGSHTSDLSGSVAPGATLHLPKSTTKINLNNNGDHIELLAPNGSIIDDITYGNAKSGAVYARSDAGWDWSGTTATNEPTAIQGSEPPVAQAVGTPAKTAAAVVAKPAVKKTTAKKITGKSITGTVIAAPGVLGSQILYINGSEVYQSKADFPAVQVGDRVRVVGTQSSDHGMARILIASASAVSIVGEDDVTPTDTSITDVTDLVGNLIRVSGVVASRSKTQMTLEGDGGQLSIIAKSTTDVSFETLAVGSMASVTGILTTYDGKLRLLPRDPTDVVVQSTPAPDTTLSSPLVADTTPMSPGVWGAIISGITSAGVVGRGVQVKLLKRS